MEIYRGTAPSVEFTHPTNDTSVRNVTWSYNGEEQNSVPFIEADGKASVRLRYLDTDGSVAVNWSFYIPGSGTHVETQYIDVVTPILPFNEIKKIIENNDDEEAATVESAVRHIIQAHCGQNFGKFVGTKSVSGSGEPNLRLPSRLISLNSINDNQFFNQTLAIRGGGWFLMSKNRGIPSIRADFDGWHENPYSSSVPIAPPNVRNYYQFIEHEEYVIDGVWGWNGVPSSVQEAARLLINDYACGDSVYRDRFLTSVTAADWRLQFHDGAFTNTGNVRANQLLAEFVLRRGWVVI